MERAGDGSVQLPVSDKAFGIQGGRSSRVVYGAAIERENKRKLKDPRFALPVWAVFFIGKNLLELKSHNHYESNTIRWPII